MRTGKALCVLALLSAAAAAEEPKLKSYHAGPWEDAIGYSQAMTAGDRIYVSGTVGADAKGFPKDMAAQMKLAYAAIEKTLRDNGSDLQHVYVERIYTTDIEALKRCEALRKSIYGAHAPAATWVEARRLYESDALIEIEVEAVIPTPKKEREAAKQ